MRSGNRRAVPGAGRCSADKEKARGRLEPAEGPRWGGTAQVKLMSWLSNENRWQHSCRSVILAQLAHCQESSGSLLICFSPSLTGSSMPLYAAIQASPPSQDKGTDHRIIEYPEL